MKIIFFVVLIFMAPISVLAQKEIGSVHTETGALYFDPVITKSELTARIPFKGIKILDKRFDTSKIGYLSRGKNSFYQIKPGAVWDSIVNSYLENTISPAAEFELVIVLKHFWKHYAQMQNGLGLNQGTALLYPSPFFVDVDVYAMNDSGYRSLFRIQHMYDEGYIGKEKAKLVRNYFRVFDSVAGRLSGADIGASVRKRNLISKDEFADYYKKKKELKVLNDGEIKNGVYLSYEEFKNNTPSVLSYKINHGKNTDEVYKVENGKETILSDFWGVYDGKKLLVNFVMNLFEAVRVENTFEVYGGTALGFRTTGGQWVGNSVLPFQIPYGSKTEIFKEVLQLNMDTGKWY